MKRSGEEFFGVARSIRRDQLAAHVLTRKLKKHPIARASFALLDILSSQREPLGEFVNVY